MTTNTEALRQKFERHIVATGRSEGELIFEAGHYLYPDVQEIWELYQAGYAAAKAEAAAPVVGRWYFVANDGAATLCVDEADARESAAEADIAFPRMAPHRAVQLVPADQLAEAQRDSERLDWMIEYCAYVVSDPECCDGYWLNYPRKDGTLWVQTTEHETPRAAIDAAKGER